jgi:hypothetical protein
MKRVYVASPFNAGTVEGIRQNILYGRLAMLDSLARGEAPYLSHLLYTQVWAETPELRTKGLEAGQVYRRAADLVAIYADLGITEGMRFAMSGAEIAGQPVELRSIDAVIGMGGPMGAASPEQWREALKAIPLRSFPALEVQP